MTLASFPASLQDAEIFSSAIYESVVIYMWLWKEVKKRIFVQNRWFYRKNPKKRQKSEKKKIFNAPEKFFYRSYDHVQGIQKVSW